MSTKDCYNCRYARTSQSASYAGPRRKTVPPECRVTDCTEGHFKDIEKCLETDTPPEWDERVKKIGKDCEDFEKK